MIEEISISNLGVIGEAVLPLGPGFTALTGETGAGKTMVVTALGLLLGERADSSAIRSGSSGALVEGRWSIDGETAAVERVRDAGGELDDGELILSRSISQEGRGRAVVGGRSAPVSVLNEIGQQLVVVHGQSDQVRLRSAAAQREALDRFSGAAISTLLGDYQAAYARWQVNQAELDVLSAERDRRSREAEELSAALADIEAVAAHRGEDQELANRADRLGNLEELRIAVTQARELLSSEALEDSTDALSLVTAARRHLDRVADHDTTLLPISEGVAAASIAVVELCGQLSSYLGSLDADAGRELEFVNDRRAQLSSLVRKYGPTLDDVLDYLDTGSIRLRELDNDATRIELLRADVDTDRASVIEFADQLSMIRSAAAVRLAHDVTMELAALAMATAEVIVTVEDRPDYSQTGKDQVAILLKPHPGAQARPLGRGASGGELSRVMLAIEVVIAGNDPVPTFIFDEIDAGVGGASAIEVGKRLAQLSRSSQVIVVTHLAQVAAFASNHLRVTKDSDGAVTASSVIQLEGGARVSEMARLLSGLPDSESGLIHARELLDTARQLQL
ncbi:MAG: DNA repair protein RecN [Rhodoglobus sp.]